MPVRTRVWGGERGGARGAVAQAHAAGAGLRERGFAEDRAALPAGISGQPVQLRVWGVPKSGRSGEDRGDAEAGDDRRELERELHAGAGAIDGCDHRASSAGEVFRYVNNTSSPARSSFSREPAGPPFLSHHPSATRYPCIPLSSTPIPWHGLHE